MQSGRCSHWGLFNSQWKERVARPGSVNLLYYPRSRVMRRIVRLVVIEIYSSIAPVGRHPAEGRK